jgi:hypothetical protein
MRPAASRPQAAAVFSTAVSLSGITSETRSLNSIKLSNFAEAPEVWRPAGPIACSPATLPTSPIGRAIQHDRARGGLSVDQPRPWSAPGHLPHARSGQCPSPLAEWRMPYSWEPPLLCGLHCSNGIRAEKFHRRPLPDYGARPKTRRPPHSPHAAGDEPRIRTPMEPLPETSGTGVLDERFRSLNHIMRPCRACRSCVSDRVAVEKRHGGHEAILEFLLGCDADVAQHRAGEFGKEALDEIEPGTVLGSERANPPTRR